jgi:chromosome segregation ATPase
MAQGSLDKLQAEINGCKDAIKELAKNVKNAKNELAELLQTIIEAKKNKEDVENVCAELQRLVTEKSIENAKID